MGRSIPWFWLLLAALLLLLPGPAGRLLLDLLGGLTLTLLLLPVLAGVAGWIGWQVLRSRLRTCGACGVASFSTEVCPACGASLLDNPASGWSDPVEPDASQITITVDAVEVDAEESLPPPGDGGI